MANVAGASATGAVPLLDLGPEANTGKISPIPLIRNHYLKLSKVEKQNFNKEGAKICIWKFMRKTFEEKVCLDWNERHRPLTCNCF